LINQQKMSRFSVCYDSFAPVWTTRFATPFVETWCEPVVGTWCEPVVGTLCKPVVETWCAPTDHRAIWTPRPALEAMTRRSTASTNDQFDVILAQLLVLIQKYATPENIAWVIGLLVKLLQSNSGGVNTTELSALKDVLSDVSPYVAYSPWGRYNVRLLEQLVSDALRR
jgi:hypothetical protein